MLLIWLYSGSFAGAVIGLLAFLCMFIAVARVVAESGLVAFQIQPVMVPLLVSAGLPAVLPFQAIAMIGYLGSTLVLDTREAIPGYAVQSMRQGELGWVFAATLFPWFSGLFGRVICHWDGGLSGHDFSK